MKPSILFTAALLTLAGCEHRKAGSAESPGSNAEKFPFKLTFVDGHVTTEASCISKAAKTAEDLKARDDLTVTGFGGVVKPEYNPNFYTFNSGCNVTIEYMAAAELQIVRFGKGEPGGCPDTWTDPWKFETMESCLEHRDQKIRAFEKEHDVLALGDQCFFYTLSAYCGNGKAPTLVGYEISGVK